MIAYLFAVLPRDLPFVQSTAGAIVLVLVGFIALVQLVQIIVQASALVIRAQDKHQYQSPAEQEARRKGLIR